MMTLQSLLADALLLGAALVAALYCFVLSRRLNRLSSTDRGLGGAIAGLSTQVEDMTRMLAVAKTDSAAASADLQRLTSEARDLAENLDMMIAACHDLPVAGAREVPPPPDTTPPGQVPQAVFGPRTILHLTPEDRADKAAPEAPDLPIFQRRRLAALAAGR